MNSVFWSSYAILWLLVLVLTYHMLRLLRSRPGPPMHSSTLAMSDHGLAIGDPFPQTQFKTTTGSEISLQPAKSQGTVVIFTTPTCPACTKLYPHLADFAKARSELGTLVLAFSHGDEQDLALDQQHVAFPWVPIPMGMLPVFKTSAFPFAYFLSPENTVLSKGVINDIGQLHLLVNSAERQRTG